MQRLDFSAPSSVEGWTSIDDRVMGGLSSSRLRFHPDGYAVFAGDVSTANGGGFASVRHNALRLGSQGTEGYRLHVRGDGKRFKLNLRMEDGLDGVNYQAGLQPPRRSLGGNLAAHQHLQSTLPRATGSECSATTP